MAFRNHQAAPYDVEPLSFNDSGLGERFDLNDVLRVSDGLLRLFGAEDDTTAALASNCEGPDRWPSSEFDSARFDSIQDEMSHGSIQQKAQGGQQKAASFVSIQQGVERRQWQAQAVQMKSPPAQESYGCVSASAPRRRIGETEAVKSRGRKGSEAGAELEPAPYNHELYQEQSAPRCCTVPYDHELYQEQTRRPSENDAGPMRMEMPGTPGKFKSRPQRSKSSCSHPKRRVGKPKKQARRKSSNDLDEIASNDTKRSKMQRRVTLDLAIPAELSLDQLLGCGASTPTSTPTLGQLLGHSSRASLLEDNGFTATTNALEYHQALINLAESMKRTELSRRQLSMQRAALALEQNQQRARQEQQRAPASAEWRRLHRSGPRTPAGTASVTSRSTSGDSPVSLSMDSNAAAFFVGDRSTLTNGLEHSRMQLKMYTDSLGSRI